MTPIILLHELIYSLIFRNQLQAIGGVIQRIVFRRETASTPRAPPARLSDQQLDDCAVPPAKSLSMIIIRGVSLKQVDESAIWLGPNAHPIVQLDLESWSQYGSWFGLRRLVSMHSLPHNLSKKTFPRHKFQICLFGVR